MQLIYTKNGVKCEGEIVGAVGGHLKVNRRTEAGGICEELVSMREAADEETFRKMWAALSPLQKKMQTDDGPVNLEDLL